MNKFNQKKIFKKINNFNLNGAGIKQQQNKSKLHKYI